MNHAWNLYTDRIRRHLWPVLALGLVAAIAGYAFGLSQPTHYTGWATLSTATTDRAPEQDGVLASGYVDYFNSSGYQNKLKRTGVVPADVTMHARTAAASPIIYVEATSESRPSAEIAAPAAAQMFRDDINAQLQVARDETIAAVRKPFDDARQANGVASGVSLDQLQQQVNQINADSTNTLKSMQLESGMSESSPNAWPGALLALIGGLLLGCLVAVAAGAVSRRTPTAAELAAKTGLAPIVEVPAAKSARSRALRTHRVQQLVNAVGLAGLPQRAVVTVTSTVATTETEEMARELARGRAAQGLRTVLVHADLHAPDAFGFGEALLDETLDLDAILRTTDTQLSEMSSGRVTGTPFTAVTAPRVAALLARLTEEFDFVVIAAPPITDAAESQILCAAGDGVLLVVDASKSRTTDIAEASALLTSFGARLIGSVLSGTSRARGFTARAGKPAVAAPRVDQLVAARTPAYAAAHSDARDQ